jgi:hypothetical protein
MKLKTKKYTGLFPTVISKERLKIFDKEYEADLNLEKDLNTDNFEKLPYKIIGLDYSK